MRDPTALSSAPAMAPVTADAAGGEPSNNSTPMRSTTVRTTFESVRDISRSRVASSVGETEMDTSDSPGEVPTVFQRYSKVLATGDQLLTGWKKLDSGLRQLDHLRLD